MKNNRLKMALIVLAIGIIVTLGISYSINSGGVIEEKFSVSYDNSWKLVNGEGYKLKHKKTGSILKIQSKVLEERYIDISLKYLINDVMFSIEEQNKDYKLINMVSDVSDMYDSYSYLYENNTEQVLVNVYKYDEVLVISYYQAESDVFDIVLDSVDTILNSLRIS